MRLTSLSVLAPMLLFCSLLLGCGGTNKKIDGAKVTAVLLKGGKPFTPPDKQNVTVSFLGVNSSSETSSPSKYDPEKNVFVVTGPTGDGVPPGNYLITVRCTPYAGSDDQDLFKGAFLMGNKVDNPKTPLKCTVTEAKEQEFTIDLDSKKVSAK